ncbi:MAG TPA: BamA/TamA family outer membrane protein [Acetobacteraceae bacterium]|nr:BamA/TamA family outer membrane protein [Acetobacteraceae bacterium]
MKGFPVLSRRRRRLARLVVLSALAGSIPVPSTALAADPQPYTVKIEPTGIPSLDKVLQASSLLISLNRKAPVSPFALVARARADAARFVIALQSFGYDAGTAAISIAGRAIEDPALPAALDATPIGTAVPVVVQVHKGVLFHLGRVELSGSVPAKARAALELAPGAPAVAADVLAARQRVLAALRAEGYALAKVSEPVATERAGAPLLDVAFTVSTGPRVDLGPVTFRGLGRVNPGFAHRVVTIHRGERFDPKKIAASRDALLSTGVFSAVRVQPAGALDAAGQLPILIETTERPRHAVSVGAAYSTDLGASVNASWTDRNVFGNAEKLTLSAEATELGGNAARQPGYNIGADFTKPDLYRRDQSLILSAHALREYLDAYDRTAYIASATISRRLTPHLSASVGLSFLRERVTQVGMTNDYNLLGVPLGLKYDTTNSLFDPTRGVRAAVTITPTVPVGGRSDTFLIGLASGSTYLDLEGKGRGVLALRALVGTIQGASALQVPPDQRFYAGGSATVRGFRYQSIGPQLALNIPEGGTSLDAASIEFRQRIGASYGVVGFVDAGQVGTTGAPFTGAVRIGAGLGFRYYTSIGPIRLDVAVPVNRQRGGDVVELYIGIGQAF